MKKCLKIILSIGFLLMFCCLSIGYAALNDELYVSGIVSYDAPDATDPELNPTIPGDEPPEIGDEFKYGDYIYIYEENGDGSKEDYVGWRVELTKQAKNDLKNGVRTTLGPIMETIDGQPITSLYGTFEDQKNLTEAPRIPTGVQTLRDTFKGCTSLVTYAGSTAPEGDFSGYYIPLTVQNMSNTFEDCIGMVSAPEIPLYVNDPSSIFHDCTSLTGVVVMNATYVSTSGEDTNNTFNSVDFKKQKVTLVGKSPVMDEIGNTGKNYCENCNGYCFEKINFDSSSGLSLKQGYFTYHYSNRKHDLNLMLTHISGTMPESITIKLGNSDEFTVYTTYEGAENNPAGLTFDTGSDTLCISYTLLDEYLDDALMPDDLSDIVISASAANSVAYSIDISNVRNLSIIGTEAETFDLESRPNLLLTLTPDEGYLLPESFTVAIGETVYAINTNGENDYETLFFDTESSTLYILGDLLPTDGSAVFVTAYAVPEAPPYTLQFVLENLTQSNYTADGGVYIQLIPDEDYLLPETFTVTIGETVYAIDTVTADNNPAGMGFDVLESKLYISGALLPDDGSTVLVTAHAVLPEEETEPTEETTEPTEETTEPTEETTEPTEETTEPTEETTEPTEETTEPTEETTAPTEETTEPTEETTAPSTEATKPVETEPPETEPESTEAPTTEPVQDME